MKKMMSIAAASLIATALTALPASAGMLGTQVTGNVQFGGNTSGPNYFDAGLGLVPQGCQNSAPNTVTVGIADPQLEFCIADMYNVDTVDFTANGLTITDHVLINAASWEMTFALDPIVTGVTLLNPQSLFRYSYAGNLLTVNFDGASAPAVYTVNFSIATADVPEPGSVALFLAAFGMLALARARRRG